MTQLDPATRTYEDGVRDSIKALPIESIPTMDQPWSSAWNACRESARKRLEALLLDRAEDLVPWKAPEPIGHELHELYLRRVVASLEQWIGSLTQNYTLEKK